MSDLVPCPSCRRHVRTGDQTCPFCDTSVEASARPSPAPRGRFTRAAVFAGALGAVAGCGTSQKPADDMSDKTSPPPPPPAMADAGVVEQAPPPSPPDAAVVEEEPVKPDKIQPHDIPMPYGAPPVRTRIV